MAGKCATMLILSFISLSVMTYAFTSNDWTVSEWGEDEDSMTLRFGLKHLEYEFEQMMEIL